MIEYPKMLYTSRDNYTIVDDKEAEKKARKNGFTDLAKLDGEKKPQAQTPVDAELELDNGNNELLDTSNSDSDVVAS